MSRFTRLLICALTFSFAALTLASVPDSIRGTVFDPSGAVVPNATVELLDSQAQIGTITTDAKGQYIFSQKIPPQSQLRVSAPGFRTAEKLIESKDGTPDLTVDMGLFDRLILVPDDPFGLLAVGGTEAGAGTRDGVHAVAHAATVGALDDPVSHFHTI